MVTLMWKRALMLAARDTALNQNWYAHSTLFNGTSSAFTRSMGMTVVIPAERHSYQFESLITRRN